MSLAVEAQSPNHWTTREVPGWEVLRKTENRDRGGYRCVSGNKESDHAAKCYQTFLAPSYCKTQQAKKVTPHQEAEVWVHSRCSINVLPRSIPRDLLLV